MKIPRLFGAVVALVAASLYQFYKVGQVGDGFGSHVDGPARLRYPSPRTLHGFQKTNRQSVDSLEAEMDQARRQVSILAGQAKLDVSKHADDLAAKLEKAQQEQAARWLKPPRPSPAVSGDHPRLRRGGLHQESRGRSST